MKKVIYTTLLFLLHKEDFCQNHFTQFYSSQFLNNPASVGRFNKSFKVAGGFRSEKNVTSLFNQSFFSLESKILNLVIPENDCFAIGIAGINEKSISDGINNNYFSFSLAYQKGLDNLGEQQIGVGFQTTFGHKRIDPPQYFFEDQLYAWIQSGFTNINAYQIGNVDVSYVDLNIGIIFQGKLNSNNYISIGSSLHHVNSPNKVFQGGELMLNRQIGGHISWESRLSEKNKIYSFFVMNLPEHKLNFITGIMYESNIKLKLYSLTAGCGYKKNTDLGTFLVPMIALKFKDFFLNISYDINISGKQVRQKGASEISLIYTHANNRNRFLENKFIKF